MRIFRQNFISILLAEITLLSEIKSLKNDRYELGFSLLPSAQILLFVQPCCLQNRCYLRCTAAAILTSVGIIMYCKSVNFRE